MALPVQQCAVRGRRANGCKIKYVLTTLQISCRRLYSYYVEITSIYILYLHDMKVEIFIILNLRGSLLKNLEASERGEPLCQLDWELHFGQVLYFSSL